MKYRIIENYKQEYIIEQKFEHDSWFPVTPMVFYTDLNQAEARLNSIIEENKEKTKKLKMKNIILEKDDEN